jgi:site-specific DNA-cytosine methylase
MCSIETVDCPPADWPRIEANVVYGNPRCTGFSTITAGYGADCHGPWAKACQDIHDLTAYALNNYDVIVWESVQQAFTVGRPLLDYLVNDVYGPAGYRVAHLLLNAASFGNAQQRKRYFFVAYRGHKNFNVSPPEIEPHYPVTYDALWDLRDRKTHAGDIHSKQGTDYNFDTHTDLTTHEWECLHILPNGWDLNLLARWDLERMPKKYQDCWRYRTSDMPFSMHGIVRLNWCRPHPTIHSSACRFVHPERHRPLTVGEISTVMGWPCIPVGPNPVAQIAKGVCPEVATWLGHQVQYYLDDAWGSEDWESSYCPKRCEWVGSDAHGKLEKTFDLTKYVGTIFDRSRYDVDMLQRHRFNVDSHTGELVRPWTKIRESSGPHDRAKGVRIRSEVDEVDVLDESTP